eukprot:gene38750-65039_t
MRDYPDHGQEAYSPSRERVEAPQRKLTQADADHFQTSKQKDFAAPHPSAYARPEA